MPLELELRGPWLGAFPSLPGEKLRPGGGGGGGGDGGARRMEKERQARQRAAINQINRIFNGADFTVGVNPVDEYQAGQTYYNPDGTVFRAPTKEVEVLVAPPRGSSSRSPNVMMPGGDAGGSYYDPKRDPAVGYWSGGGDAGEQFYLNPGVYRKSTGGDADMTTGYYRKDRVTDMAAINKLLKEGALFSGVERVPGMDREALYRDHQDAVTQLNQDDVNRQYRTAERHNRFGLARSGLSGGSVDVDSNAEIGRILNEGLMKAVGIGQDAAADLRMQDERTRQNLIGMAQSGIDTGHVSQLALSGLRANEAAAAGARSGATIGNVFSDLLYAYMMNQQNNAFQQGFRPYQQQRYGNVSTRDGGHSGTVV